MLDPLSNTYGSKTLFLDSDESLFDYNFNNKDSGDWESSELRYFLNNAFIDDSFTSVEDRSIAKSTIEGGKPFSEGSFEEYMYSKTTGLTGDYVFVLDAADVTNEDYGYTSDPGWELTSGQWSDMTFKKTSAQNRSKYYDGSSYHYWLRNSGSIYNGTTATVFDVGCFGWAYESGNAGVAPALNIKQDSIIFATDISGKGPGKVNSEYKLTLYDKDINIKTAYNERAECTGRKVTIPYVLSGSHGSYISRVSVLITDKSYQYGNANNAKILYYGELDGGLEVTTTYDYVDIVNYGTFLLPGNLNASGWGNDYYVSIVAEDTRGLYMTDYASLPYSVEAPKVTVQTGWVKYDDGWYYYDENGSTVHGWAKIDGSWYYLSNDGKMLTGWIQSGGAWYYLGGNGIMRTGWQAIGKTPYGADIWYYLGGDGAMRTGWQQIDGKYYYFVDDGLMASSEWRGGYWINADGSWTYPYKASWKHNSQGWWYEDTSGWYAKDCEVKIDGVEYCFNKDGYWIS